MMTSYTVLEVSTEGSLEGKVEIDFNRDVVQCVRRKGGYSTVIQIDQKRIRPNST
jgi:hypothetical protein